MDNGLFLINTHNGIKNKLPRIDINDYPAVKTHLDQYWDRISTRADKGDTPYNLRNCAYLEDFSKPKVMWKINASKLIIFANAKIFRLTIGLRKLSAAQRTIQNGSWEIF